MPSPVDPFAEVLYNRPIVGGVLIPGKTVVSASRTFDWEVKKAAGSSGAATEFNGRPPATFTMTHQIVKDPVLGINQFEEFETFLAMLEEGNKKQPPTAWPVYSPDLNLLALTTAVVTEIGSLEHDGQGGATCTTKWLEFVAPTPAKGSPQKKTGTKGSDQNADKKKELEKLVEEAKRV